MEIIIRPARLDEMDALTDLSLRSKRSNGYDDAFMAACREELTVTPERMAEGDYWVAEVQAGVLCGCVCLLDEGFSEESGARSAEIHAFFIDPDFKRSGVGRRLWQKVLQLAEEKGISKLHLDADPAAVPFYQAMGFTISHETPSGSIPGRTIPRMDLELS